jgi:hypothetical protein
VNVIDLQNKARPMAGRIEHYWFENERTGLKRTLFHRIVVPFAPFDSGLDYVRQPESTELVVEWIDLGLADPADLDGVVIASGVTPHVEASIYVGSAHNWADIQELRLTKEGDHYRVRFKALIDFEHEAVAQNEPLEFETTARYVGGV